MRLISNEQCRLHRDVGQRTKGKKCSSSLSDSDGAKALMSEDWRPPCMLSEPPTLRDRCRHHPKNGANPSGRHGP